MWEIPFYIIIAPILTLAITFICSIKFKNYFHGPVIVLAVLNIPIVVLSLLKYNVGWEAIFGWAVFYSLVSLLISLVIRMIHNRQVTV